MDRDRLEHILTHAPNVENFKWVEHDKYGFTRKCEFDVRGVHYKIVWFINESTLYVGELAIRFNDIAVESTWPNNFRRNIHFFLKGEIVAILPIEEWKEV